jgi:hypothetical protein
MYSLQSAFAIQIDTNNNNNNNNNNNKFTDFRISQLQLSYCPSSF